MQRKSLDERKIRFKEEIEVEFYNPMQFGPYMVSSMHANNVGVVSGPLGDSLSYCFLDKRGLVCDVPEVIALKYIRRVRCRV